MNKKVGTLVTAICEGLVGVLLLIDPVAFTTGIITVLGVLMVLDGVVRIIRYFRAAPQEGMISQGLTMGLLALCAGLFCIFGSQWFLVTFPVLAVIYGIVTLIMGIFKVEMTVDLLRLKNHHWPWHAISAVVTLAAAAVILMNPFTTTAVLWMFAGVSLIVEAVLDVLSLFLGKKRASVEEYVEVMHSEVQDAETADAPAE